jgi:hypothetical protein
MRRIDKGTKAVAEEWGLENRLLQRTECGKGAVFTSQLYARNMRAEMYTEMSEDVLEEIDQCVSPPPPPAAVLRRPYPTCDVG